MSSSSAKLAASEVAHLSSGRPKTVRLDTLHAPTSTACLRCRVPLLLDVWISILLLIHSAYCAAETNLVSSKLNDGCTVRFDTSSCINLMTINEVQLTTTMMRIKVLLFSLRARRRDTADIVIWDQYGSRGTTPPSRTRNKRTPYTSTTPTSLCDMVLVQR